MDDHIVVRAHVAEEAHEAALVEFHILLGQRSLVLHRQGIEALLDEDIAGDAHDVLFDEGALVNEELDAVRGEELLEFEAVDPRGIGPLDVEEDVVVVDDVPDFDPEGLRVAKRAERDAVDRDEGQNGVAAVRVEDGVDPLEVQDEFVPIRVGVEAIDPQGVPALFVEDGHAAFEAQQVLVGDRNVDRPVVRVEVGLQTGRDRKRLLLLGDELLVHGQGIPKAPRKARMSLTKTRWFWSTMSNAMHSGRQNAAWLSNRPSNSTKSAEPRSPSPFRSPGQEAHRTSNEASAWHPSAAVDCTQYAPAGSTAPQALSQAMPSSS
jgi:hypothetical protein